MPSYSVYAINVADPPKWRPGEELAATLFIGMTIILVLEINVEIFRAFKKRQGLYFWSVEIGSWGVAIKTIGNILKYLESPSTDRIWIFNALLLTVGWAVYCTTQCLVLYARLHLVIQSRKIQRYVLVMIVSTSFVFIIPTFVATFPAHNTSDHKMSSTWSPRKVVVERYTQIGYTITESIISGLYIWSLTKLLDLKSSVRQRRVMLDLIYVNIIVIAFDVIVVLLVYTNQVGLSHPVQTFTYILKLRLEFIVLNQLMAVAARGIRRETFGEKRYHRPSAQEICPPSINLPSPEHDQSSQVAIRRDSSTPAHSDMPSPILFSENSPSPQSTYPNGHPDHFDSTIQTSQPEPDVEILDRNDSTVSNMASGDEKPLTHLNRSHQNEARESIQQSEGSKPHQPRHSRRSQLFRFSRPWRGGSGDDHEVERIPVARRKRDDRRDHSHIDDDEDEEIQIYMWDRRGDAVLEVPWFRSTVRA